jgi:hypothetical protein
MTSCNVYVVHYANGFILRNSNHDQCRQQRIHQHPLRMIHNREVTGETNMDATKQCEADRRRYIKHIFYATTITLLSSFTAMNQPVNAATTTATPEDTVWITGKMPLIPGQKPKDKTDLTGTRKDPNFLRSLSDCKNQCENMTGSNDGYAKGKNECLSECQDICCTTYQQCTFPIVQRI